MQFYEPLLQATSSDCPAVGSRGSGNLKCRRSLRNGEAEEVLFAWSPTRRTEAASCRQVAPELVQMRLRGCRWASEAELFQRSVLLLRYGVGLEAEAWSTAGMWPCSRGEVYPSHFLSAMCRSCRV